MNLLDVLITDGLLLQADYYLSVGLRCKPAASVTGFSFSPVALSLLPGPFTRSFSLALLTHHDLLPARK